VKNTKEGFNL